MKPWRARQFEKKTSVTLRGAGFFCFWELLKNGGEASKIRGEPGTALEEAFEFSCQINHILSYIAINKSGLMEIRP